MPLDPKTIDLPTLASLAGAAADEHVLERTRAGGHPRIRRSHGYVFQQLLTGPRAIGELAEALGMTQQAASKFVRELEALGYVERLTDAQDGRVRRAALTARGRAVIERARAARAALDAALVERLGTRAVASAKQVLIGLLEGTGGLDAVRQRSVKLPSP